MDLEKQRRPSLTIIQKSELLLEEEGMVVKEANDNTHYRWIEESKSL